MNHQMFGEQSIKKIIAVSDDLLEQDHNDVLISMLRQIITRCGLSDRYGVMAASDLEGLTGKWTPYVLITESLSHVASLPEFRICVSDYEYGAKEGSTYHHTTFSTEDDGADFVVRNVRPFQNMGYTFDLVALGIIGRIHFISDDAQMLRAALIAASAALSCGISFANVVEVLNGISAMYFRSSCAAR